MYPVLIALNHVQVDNRGASASQHRLTSALLCGHASLPLSKAGSYHSASATELKAGEVAGIQPLPSTDRYADLSIHGCPTRPSQVVSSSDLGKWSPLGTQVAETKDGQGVWAVPSGPQTLERGGIPVCGVALREDSFPAGGCGDRRLPFRLGSMAPTVFSSRALSTRLLYANRWKLFSQWCVAQGEVPETCSVVVILHFLQYV